MGDRRLIRTALVSASAKTNAGTVSNTKTINAPKTCEREQKHADTRTTHLVETHAEKNFEHGLIAHESDTRDPMTIVKPLNNHSATPMSFSEQTQPISPHRTATFAALLEDAILSLPLVLRCP